jgi:hypothetical protein
MGFHRAHHARLDSKLLSKWATFIVDGAATIHYPPRIPEFDDLINEPLLKRHLKRDPEGSTFNDPNGVEYQSNSAAGSIMKEVHYHHHRSHKRPNDYYDDDSHESSPPKLKRRKQNKKYRPDSSSSSGSSFILNHITMSPFAKFCKESDTGYQWESVFNTLQEGDVGMDLLGTNSAISDTKLKGLCPALKPATAKRLANYHKKWIKQSV